MAFATEALTGFVASFLLSLEQESEWPGAYRASQLARVK